ncbi:MAG TPA: winged helix-turn-helix domain-containing protein [Solirubrobacterales bacterium]|nr:winged helix-turn-helix domain-containing protein [Solirubrobacterales bacterium]
MTDEGQSGSRRDRGKGGRGSAKAKGKAKPKAKGKPRSKRRSNRDTTQKARERAAGLVPNPNFKVIASDPLKAQIVAVALQRPYSPSEYAREAGVDLRIASYAFKVLREKGVLELVQEEKVRGATFKHLYRATEAALVSDADWGHLSEALRPVFTGTILQDFSARVTQAIETGHLFSRDDFCLYWAPADLDEIAWKEQVEIYNWCIEASKQLVVETTNRRANGESEGGFHATFAIAAFPSPTHGEFKKHAAKVKRKGRGEGRAKRTRAKGESAGGPQGGGSADGKSKDTTKRQKGKG